MSKHKGKQYSSDFKAKVVLELLREESSLNQICSKHGVTPKTLRTWKVLFMKNANLAFNIEHAVSEHKETIALKSKEVDELHRQLGKRTAELEWVSKKLKSLGFEDKRDFIEPELKHISLSRQCELFGFNRSSYYYQSCIDENKKMRLLEAVDNVYSEVPFYGYRKVHKALSEQGFSTGVNQVRLAMRELGLKTIYPTKSVKTTMANIEHKKYPYLLRDLEINKANQVWSTDITYIKVDGGFVYLAAVIDWYSKAILSHRISNIMDTTLVLDVLQDAINQYGIPEIFNTDQGSQYTSQDHTQLLLDHGIQISMDGKGRATDNIAIERFWRSAKYENIYISEYKNMRTLKMGVAEYIRFYNLKRFHPDFRTFYKG